MQGSLQVCACALNIYNIMILMFLVLTTDLCELCFIAMIKDRQNCSFENAGTLDV